MRIKIFNIHYFQIFLLMVQSINNVQVLEWAHFDFNKPAFQVIFNKINNEVIVGARDYIYRLTSDKFLEKENLEIGLLEDSPKCLPPPEFCNTTKDFVSNDNKILVIKYENSKPASLLACGDVYQGMCLKFKANDLSDNHYYGSNNDTSSFVGSRTSSYAFFASYFSDDVLVVAHSYDGRPIGYSPPLISLRKMDGEKGMNFFFFKLAK